MEKCNEEQHIFPIIQNTLYYIIARQPPRNRQYTFCFNTQQILFQTIKSQQVQPPSIITLAKFIQFLRGILKDPQYKTKQIYYHSILQQKHKLNTCFLISAFEIIVLDRPVDEIIHKYRGLKFSNYGDKGWVDYSLLQALKSLNRASTLLLYSLKSEKVKEYVLYGEEKEGGITTVVPRKIVVFQWPNGDVTGELKKKVGVTAGKYAKAFSHFNVTEVLRIHTDDYVEEFDGSVFKKAGIGHRSLTVYNTMEPEYEFFTKALEILSKQGVYAIISQDDFGVSMLLVCVYLIKRYNIKPMDIIPWCKMIVPGCMRPQHIAYLRQKYEYLTGAKKYLTVNNAQLNRNISILHS